MSNDFIEEGTVDVRKDLIKKLVVNLAIPEDVINRIISHEFTSVAKAMHHHDSVEISGFGKFIFRKDKIKNEIEKRKMYIVKLEKRMEMDIPESQKEYYRKKIQKLIIEMGVLERRENA